MSTLKERLSADRVAAMKARDTTTTNVLRNVLGTIQTQEKAGKTATEFDDAQVLTVLTKEVKKRRETAQTYRDAGILDRALVEDAEADLISQYVPQALNEDEVLALVQEVIAETGASSMKDMGNVTKTVLARAAGRTDGKTVSTLVRQNLA